MMSDSPSSVWQDEERLGALAMQFRSTKDLTRRAEVARVYAEVVDRLIQSGCWQEMPAFEDQLPDEWMPKSFFDFWEC